MRIIKAAKRTEEYITTCDNCKSILGLTSQDISNGSSGYDYYCAVCNCRNHIKAKDRSELFPWVMEEQSNELQSDNIMRINAL